MERRSVFGRGFVAIAPLWLGVVPFGVVYAVIARDAGLSVVETQAMSVLVFAGSAQFSAAGLFATGATALEIVLTTFLLNVRHVLYGLALGRRLPLEGWRRPAAAYFLTDEVFGVVATRPHGDVRLPARSGAQPVLHVEPRDARRCLPRCGDPGPRRARSRSRVPARLPRAARATRPHAH